MSSAIFLSFSNIFLDSFKSGDKYYEAILTRFVKKDETVKIWPDIDYAKIGGLSREVVTKLDKVRPATLGEASRISGITPAAIVAILGYMKNNKPN